MAIKNLTDTPNKDLTPEQRRNKRRAKELNIRDVNYDSIPDRDQVDMGALESDLQWVAGIISAVSELQDIFLKNVDAGSFDAESGSQGIKNFQNDIMDSDWWKTNNTFARAAFAKKQTDPESYKVDIENADERVRREARAMGVQLDDAEITTLANQVVVDGWDRADREFKLRDALNQYIDRSMQQGRPRGELGLYASQFRNTASANGLRFDDNYYQALAKSVTSGLLSEEDAELEIRDQAASLWPTYSEKIRAGYNVRDLASGYIYTMANELEIDPQSISLDDQYIRGALTGIDDQGNPRAKSLWEFQRELRNDPRWMNTNKAQNEVTSIASEVMQMFGLRG
jgi:HSP20 family molecular chaperone IbpA